MYSISTEVVFKGGSGLARLPGLRDPRSIMRRNSPQSSVFHPAVLLGSTYVCGPLDGTRAREEQCLIQNTAHNRPAGLFKGSTRFKHPYWDCHMDPRKEKKNQCLLDNQVIQRARMPTPKQYVHRKVQPGELVTLLLCCCWRWSIMLLDIESIVRSFVRSCTSGGRLGRGPRDGSRERHG